MRMLHLFALIVSLNLFACVTGDNETGEDPGELDGMLDEEDAEAPDSYDLVELEEADLPALEHEQRAAADASFVREVRAALETRSVQPW